MVPSRLVARVCAGIVALLCSVLVATAPAATISGAVVSPSIVWIVGPASRGPAQEMRNVEKSFMPELLVVSVGGIVRFPNDDPFFHSIYSSSDADAFDIGFYGNGPGKEVSFERTGIVDVRCHIHAKMHATIVVVDGPYLRADGAFSFAGVVPGNTTVSAWNASEGLRTRRVRVVNANDTVTLARGI